MAKQKQAKNQRSPAAIVSNTTIQTATRQCSSGAGAGLSLPPLAQNPRDVELVTGTVTLGAGCYLVTGAGGTGKSVFSRGLAYHAVQSGWEDVVVIYCFEAGAQSSAKIIKTQGMGTPSLLFSSARNFLNVGGRPGEPASYGDLFAYLSELVSNRQPNSPLALVVCDSVGDPMRSYNVEGRRGEASAAQGMMPSDREFITRLNNLAQAWSLVLLCVVNTELVPFVNSLSGAVQGMITVTAATSARKEKDRVVGRQTQEMVISTEALANAARSMGYPDKEGGVGTSMAGFTVA